MPNELLTQRSLRRVLILADESADWKIAGLRQLDRLALSLNEYAETHERLSLCVSWKNAYRAALPNDSRLESISISDRADEFISDERGVDLVLSTRVFLHRGAIEELFAALPSAAADLSDWQDTAGEARANFACLAERTSEQPWQYISAQREIPACERRFLRGNGKSQDGIVSRYVNRPISRWLSRWLLKTPITPSMWSLLIFVLPILACFAFVRGTYAGFVIGAAIFQLYSIIDGCDGEIARAKFMQTEFGRRLDSFCDMVGNVMLAICLGIGLTREHATTSNSEWLFFFEGILAAILILTSEGIVFVRRNRGETNNPSPRWNGVLYQRHHEFVERSGILLLGDEVARWVLILTKRDMEMLAFFVFALLAIPSLNLHLQLIAAAASTALASNAFLRQAAPAVAQEAS
jgi:phosphatidylglycerophosphate synthase